MNTCPHCGMPATLAAEFACGTQMRGKEVVRFWRCYEIEIHRLKRRVSVLTEAGQDAVNFAEGLHHEYERVVAGWRKAKE